MGKSPEASDGKKKIHSKPQSRHNGSERHRICGLCKKNFDEKELPLHRGNCVHKEPYKGSPKNLPIASDAAGSTFQYFVGGVKYPKTLTDIKEMIAKGTWGVGCRRAHYGTLGGIGYRRRWASDHKNNDINGEMLLCKAERMLSEYHLNPIHVEFAKLQENPEIIGFPNVEQTLPLGPIGVPQSRTGLQAQAEGPCTNMYIGINYSPVLSAPNATGFHDPPPAVAKMLKVKSCQDSCPVCQMRSCVSCADCCLHYDFPQDKSLTELWAYQESRIYKHHRVYFCMGTNTYAIEGGFTAIFDGATLPHGMWAPEHLLKEPFLSPWTAFAFVKK